MDTNMKRTFVLALLLLLSSFLLAQTNAAPIQAPTPVGTGAKVGVIDMQGAIVGTNEGQRDFDALNKKFEPRRTELQKLNTEIETLKKQLDTQGPKLAADARATLVKSIDTKTKSLQRSAEDSQNEYNQQRDEITQRILQKLAPIVTKYTADSGYGLIIDASVPWPQGPVVLATPAVNITKPVIDAYNQQSGIPAPPAATPNATAPPSKPK
jgi:outer membrane protein